MIVERGAHGLLMIIGQLPTGMAIRMITRVSKNAYEARTNSEIRNLVLEHNILCGI